MLSGGSQDNAISTAKECVVFLICSLNKDITAPHPDINVQLLHERSVLTLYKKFVGDHCNAKITGCLLMYISRVSEF